MGSIPPRFSHILELCLYCRSLPKSTAFYRDVLHLEPLMETPRVSGFSLGPTTLLLFQRGNTLPDSPMPNNAGIIPGHGLSDSSSDQNVELKTHFCLAVERKEQVDEWEKRLRDQGVNVLSRVKWPAGGESVYFNDPDQHVGEIASRGIWKNW